MSTKKIYRIVQVDNVNYESCHFDKCTTIAEAIKSENEIEIIGNFVSEEE